MNTADVSNGNTACDAVKVSNKAILLSAFVLIVIPCWVRGVLNEHSLCTAKGYACLLLSIGFEPL